MSINGVLEDLALADVLQFVHLGRRSGTLYLWQDNEHRAEIGFHEGRIISAWTPGHRKLGDLLVAAGLLEPATLNHALESQRLEHGERTIGQILLQSGTVTQRDVHRVLKEQVEATIFDLVTWRQGNFHFEVDELHPVDEIGLTPDEVLDNLDLNTQMLLLEATRIFDERHREPAAAPPPSSSLDAKLKRAGLATGTLPAVSGAPGSTMSPAGAPQSGAPQPGASQPGAPPPGGPRGRGLGGALPRTAGGRGAGRSPVSGDGAYRQRSADRPQRRATEPRLESLRCQVVSDDPELAAELRRQLPAELVRIVAVRLLEAGNRLPGEGASPLVLLDLRSGELSCEVSIATLARTRPSAPLVALVEDPAMAAEAYRAGVLAVVQSPSAMVDCCLSMIRVFSHPQPQGTFGYAHRGGLSRFRQAIFDVQSGLLSATMALNLMHVISESVERAVLFLVQGDELRAVGAFGFAIDGGPLAEVTSGLRLRVGPEHGLRRAMESGEPLSLDHDAARLPTRLTDLLGKPSSGQVVLFPVFGAERLISLIYTDNGELPEEIQDLKILELATSQVGLAFENELLSQSMDGGLDGEPDPFQRSTQ